jgi:hypothetical protein
VRLALIILLYLGSKANRERHEGLQYLWIDSLCIIQDSSSDWEGESVKMADIYGNSFLTITANLQADSNGGCFNKRSIPHDWLRAQLGHSRKRATLNITNVNSQGEATTLVLYQTERARNRDMPWPLQASPLNERGWILQERMLPARSVHFTQTQVVWECRSWYKQEDLIPDDPAHVEPQSRLLMKNFVASSKLTLPGFSDSEWGKGIPPEIREVWQSTAQQPNRMRWERNVVTPFCQRKFAFYEDRPVAIIGLAKIWQQLQKEKDEYVAGLWRSNLASGLYWRHCGGCAREKTPTRYPTWSWTAHDCSIRWDVKEFEYIDADFSLLDMRFSYRNRAVTDPLQPVDGGYIHVRGRTCGVSVECQRVIEDKEGPHIQGYVDDHSVKLFIDHPELTLPVRPPAVYTLLALMHIDMASQSKRYTQALVLCRRRQDVNQELGAYERVGIAEIAFNWQDSGNLRDNFWADQSLREMLLY